jgi:hypothetical protein
VELVTDKFHRYLMYAAGGAMLAFLYLWKNGGAPRPAGSHGGLIVVRAPGGQVAQSNVGAISGTTVSGTAPGQIWNGARP